MNPTKKSRIDALTYEELLHDHRFAPVGDPRYQGEEGEYRMNRLRELRSELSKGEHARASKAIGWDKP